MSLKITNNATPSDKLWDEIWSNSDTATFCHSRQWYDVWKTYTNGQFLPSPVLLDFSDGKQAVIPICLHSILKGSVKRYISSPATTYGGWFSSDELEDMHHDLILDFISSQYPKLIVRLNPLIPYAPKGFATYLKDDFTQIIPLKDDFKVTFKTWSKGHRAAVTQGKKAGVTTRLAKSDDDWEQFYKIYLDSLVRWGPKATSKYKPEFFQSFRKIDSSYARLWLAEFEDKLIAGAFIFYAKSHAMYGYSAALGQYFKVRAMNVLLHDAIKDAAERKYKYFDMSPSGGHENVMSFKKRFGAEKVPVGILDRQPWWLKCMEKTYKAWLIKFS